MNRASIGDGGARAALFAVRLALLIIPAAGATPSPTPAMTPAPEADEEGLMDMSDEGMSACGRDG